MTTEYARLRFKRFLFIGFFLLSGLTAFSQATFVSATYQTLSQQEVDVVFSQAVTIGATPTAGWTVTVNGTALTGASILSVSAFTSTIVRVKFNASTVPGHAATEPFVKPGETVKISYASPPGTLTSSGGVTAFTNQSATNTWNFDCATDCAYFNEIDYGLVNQCSPVTMNFHAWIYRFSLRFRNSTKWQAGANLIYYGISWGDATVSNIVPYQSDASANANATYIHTAFATPVVLMAVEPTHVYPNSIPAAAPNECHWTATLTPYVNNVQTCSSLATSHSFATFSTDNQLQGTLAMPPLVANTDQVCLGNNVNMSFNDNTTLNCNILQDNVVYNQSTRWVRIIYGSQNGASGNIPNVQVTLPAALGGGTVSVTNSAGTIAPVGGYYPVTGNAPYAVNNQPDVNGVIQVPAPVTAPTGTQFMATITTTTAANQVAGQQFYVQIQYWDVCNPYSGNPLSPAPVTLSAPITIVTAPAPLTTAGQAICYSAANNITGINFSTASSIGAARTGVNWYKANPKAGGAQITNPAGTNSLTFAANQYTSKGGTGTFAINNTNGAYYSLWATQLAGSGPVTCESQPIEVVIFQQPNILTNTPTITSGPTDVCNNTSATYTSSVPTTPKTIAVNTFTNTGVAPENGAISLVTNDFWTKGFPSGVTLTPTQGTSISASFAIVPEPGPSTTNNIGVNLQYTGSPVVTITTPITSPAPPPALPANYNITPLTNCPNNSSTTAVTVWGVSSGGSINLPSQTICENATPATITLSGFRGTIQNWQMQVNGGGFAINAALGTGATPTISAATVPIVGGAQTTYQFYAVVKNGPVCSAVNSPTATIIVNPRPTSAAISGTATICTGSPTNLAVTITGGASPYTVVYSNGSSNFTVSGYTSGSNIAVSPTVNTTYTLVSVTDANGCTPVTLSGSAVVTVRNLSAAIASTGATSLCPSPNSTTIAFNVTDNNGNALTTYTVNYQDNLAGTYTTGAGYTSGNNVTLTNIASTRTFTITNITDPLGCTTNPNTGSVAITVGSAPSAATLAGPGSVCQNATANLTLTITGGVSPYVIQYNNGSSTTTVNPYTSGSNISVPTAVAGSTTYTVTSIKDACNASYGGAITGNPQTVVVNPLPIGSNSTPAAVCSQTNLNINPATNITNGVASTFTWTAAYTGGMTGPASGTGNITGVVVNKTSAAQTATFTVTPKAVTGSCTGATFTITQSVNPEPVASNQTLTALCSPATVNINPQTQGVNQAGGNSVASTFAWTGSYGALTGGVASGTGNITGFTLTNTTAAAINAVFTVTPTSSAGGCVGSSFTMTLPVNPLANLPGGLPANDTKCVNQNSSFSISGATGPGITYQWQVSTNGGASFSNLSNVAPYSNVTTATMNITGVTSGLNNNQYRAVVTTTGSCTINSPAATLTVNPLPTSTDPAPKLCEDVFGGGSHANVDLTSFNASVTNAPTVAWFNDAAHTNSVATPTSVTVTNGKIFYFVATSAASCTISGQITFTVNPLPTAVNQNLSFCENTPFPPHSNTVGPIDLTSNNLTIAGGSLTNRTVTWFSDAALTTTIATPTAYTFSLVLPATTQTIYAKVTNTTTGCTNVATVNLTIKPRPADNPIQGNTSVCTGNSILLYQLDPTFNPGSNYTWSVVGTPPAAVTVFGGGGTNSANFFVLLKFPSATGTVALNVYETLNGCQGNTATMTINVNAAPAPNTIDGLTQVCTGQTAVPYNVHSPNVGSTYAWVVTGATPSGTGSTINVDFGAISPVTIQVTETSSSLCVGAPATTTVTVNPRPSMTSSSTATVCSGAVPSLNFTSSIPSTYAWTVASITGSLTGVTVGQSGTGNLSSTFTGAGVIRNTTGAVGSVTFNVTPTATAAPNCGGNTQSVVLTVNPEPVLVNPQTKTICSGAQVNYEILTSPLNLPSGTVFNWPAPVMSDASTQGTAGVNVAAGAPGTLHITDVLTNNSSSAITATYTITPTSGSGCAGTPRTVVVTVNPQPAMSASLDKTVCSGSAIGLTLSVAAGSAAANNYNITSVSIPGGLTPGANAIVPATGVNSTYLSNDSYLNTSTSPLIVSYTVVPVTASACQGASKIISITINPQPSLSASLDKTICSSSATGLSLTTAAGSTPATAYNVLGISVAPGLVAGGSNALPANNVGSNYLAADVFTNTTAAALTVVYQVVPVSSLGCNGNPPKSITITVNPEPVIGNGNITVCSGSAINLTLTTNGTSVAAASYNITAKSVAPGLVSGGSNAAIANGVPAGYLAADVYTNTTAAPLTVTYTVVPVSSTPCSGQAKVITVTINPEPVMSSSLNDAVCSDVAIGLVLNTNGTSIGAASYNVTAHAISAGLTPNAGNASPGVTGVADTYLANDVYTNTGNVARTVTYTVVPVSSSGCVGASKVITITINPEPVMSTTLDATVCSIVPIGLTLNTNGASVAAANYNITAVTVAGGLTPGSNAPLPASGVAANYLAGDTYSNTGTTPLTVTYTVIPVSAAGCVGNSKVITLTISPEPVVSSTLNTTVCSGSPTLLTLNTNGTSVAASNYNVTSISVAPGLTPNAANAVTANNVAANYLANDKFTNTGNTSLGVVYTVVPLSAAGCPGPSKTITVTINPEPILSSALNNTVCSDVAIGLTLNTNGTSVAASTYNITAKTTAGGLVGNSSNASAPNLTGVAANYLAADKYTNTGSSALTVTYTVVPISASSCSGQPVVVTMTINPEPVLSTSLNNTVCSNTVTGLTLNTNGTSVAAANYNFTNVALAAGLTAAGTNAPIANGVPANDLAADKFQNVTAGALTATYTVVPVSAATCLGDPANVVMTINPEPVMSNLLDATVCSDASINLVLNTNGTSVGALTYNVTAQTISGSLAPAGANTNAPATGVGPSFLANNKFTNVSNALQNVTYTVVPVSSVSCVGTSKIITISVNPKPVLSSTLNKTVCSSVQTGLTLITNGTSVAAQSYNINALVLGGGLTAAGGNAPVTATGVAAGYLSLDVFTNTGAGSLDATYSIVPVSAAGCAGASVDVKVTILPQPVMSSTLDATLCSGSTIGLTLATNGTSVAAANYNIPTSSVSGGLVAGGSNAPIPGTSVVAGYLSNDKYTNTTNSSLTVAYTVIPVSAANCQGASKVITMTINPEPVVASGLDKAVCSGSTIALTLNTNGTSVAAANYAVTNSTMAVGLTAAGSNVTVPTTTNVAANYLASDKYTNTGLGSLNVTYTVVPYSGLNCQGQPKVITIGINPEPVMATPNVTVCSGLPIGLTLKTNATSVAAGSYNIISETVGGTLTPSGSNVASPSSAVAAAYLANNSFKNVASSSQTVSYVVAPVSAATCVGGTATIVVTVNPEPVGSNFTDPKCASTLNQNLQSQVTNSITSVFTYTVSSNNAGVPAKPNRTVASSAPITDSYTNTTGTPATITYTVTPFSSANNCQGATFTYVVVISPTPVGANATTAAVCSRTVISINPQADITNGVTSTFTWTAVYDGGLTGGVNSGTGNINENLTNQTASALNATYTVTPSSGPCAGSTFTIKQPVNPEPVMDPTLAAKTICSNNATSPHATGIVLNTNGISVAASSYAVSLVSQDIGLTGTPTTGAALTANAIKNDAFNNVGAVPLKVTYQTTPKSAAGCVGSPLSIAVTVNPEPVVAPITNTVCSKTSSAITLATNGSSVGASTYTLTAVTVPGTITADAANVANLGLPQTGTVALVSNDKYTNKTSGAVNVNYSILATSGAGCSGVPQSIVLTVNPEPILVPGAVTICSGVAPGAAINLGTAVGSAAITSYNLKQISVPTGLTANGTNAGLGTYNVNNFLGSDVFTNTTNASLAVVYKIAPTANTCTGDDYTVTLTVNPAPALASLAAIVCSNGATGITFATAATSVAATKYNINAPVIAAGLTQTAGNSGARSNVGSGEISGDKFLNNTNGVLTVTYPVIPVSSANCLGPVQNVVLTVEPSVVANPIAASSICSSTATNFTLTSPTVPSAGSITFNYTATSSIGGLMSGYQSTASSLPNPKQITDTLVNNSNSPATLTYAVTPVAAGAKNGVGCNGTPINVVVTVDPLPKLTPSPSAQTICENSASSVVLNSATSPSAGTIQFTVTKITPDAGLTQTSPVVTTYTKGQTLADIWSNSNSSVASVVYTLKPSVSGGLGCVGKTVDITLNINPRPVVTSTIISPTIVPAAICSNDIVNISLSGDVSSTVNSWTASVTSGSAAGQANGSGDLIFQTLKNTGSVPANVRYVVTPKASGCAGAPINIDIEVDPIPTVALTNPTPVCYGGTLNVPLSSPVSGTTFSWVVDPNNSGVPLTGSGATINQVLIDTLTSSQDFINYTITATGPGATACVSNPKTMSVTAAPQMSAKFLNDPTWLCLSVGSNKDVLNVDIKGQTPFTLQYSDGSTTTTLTKVGNTKIIPIQPTATTTYSLVSLKDAFGCSVPVNSSVTFTVGNTNSNFSLLSAAAQCTPYKGVFQYNEMNGNTYRWTWNDGTPDSIYTATADVTGKTVSHWFVNTSQTSTLKLNVALQDSLSAVYPNNGCLVSTLKSNVVSVYAQVKTSISLDKPAICSGEVVHINNQTAGVPSTGHTWYYQYVGNSTQFGNATSKNVNYTLNIDSTMSNPQTVRVFYHATNGHCPADTTVDVTVYKSIKANFSSVVPIFAGGHANVVFTNTSKAGLDWPNFQFDWDFGLDAHPATLTSSASPINIDYTSPGVRDITLTATNINALAAGLTCQSTVTKTINILLAPLVCKFTIDPKRACYPTKINVTSNSSTGDRYKWYVIDQVNADTVASSNAALPIFSISNDGQYVVGLVTSNSLTGQTASDTAHLVLYPKPVSIFDAYPHVVYVPDQELTTVNGAGTTADKYLWEFGDGGTSTDFAPKYKYKFEGVDTLKFTAMYDHGGGVICSSTSYKIILAKQGGVAKIPNAFTPSSAGPSSGTGSGSGGNSGDANNYIFLPQVKGVEEFNLQIYDRWGNLVFESNNQTVGWDGYDQNGRLMSAGVYVYKLTLRLSDQQRTTQVGDVTLIR